MAITKITTPDREAWKAVVGFEGKYEVSDHGNVKSLNYHRERRERLLNQYEDRYGYMKVVLRKNNRPHYCTVHRLVAEAFVPNEDFKKCVDHIDCNTKNNDASNLRWVTNKENLIHSHNLNRQVINATPIIATHDDGRQMHFYSQREAERCLGVGQWAITRFLHGGNPDTKGWKFKYDN